MTDFAASAASKVSAAPLAGYWETNVVRAQKTNAMALIHMHKVQTPVQPNCAYTFVEAMAPMPLPME